MPDASLVEWGLLPAPMLDISAYIEPHYERLPRVSTDGGWGLTFFLRAVAEQATDAVRRAKRLPTLWEDYRNW